MWGHPLLCIPPCTHRAMARKASSTFMPVLALVSMKGTPYSCEGSTGPLVASPKTPLLTAPFLHPLPALSQCYAARATQSMEHRRWHNHEVPKRCASAWGTMGCSRGCGQIRFRFSSPWPARLHPLSSPSSHCSRRPVREGQHHHCALSSMGGCGGFQELQELASGSQEHAVPGGERRAH